jgi:MFS family permease
MLLSEPIERARTIYQEYPNQFWVVIGATFIDRIGGALMFPFFSLYITRKFGVGMTEVGLLFTLFSVTGMLGSTLGGALSDYLGRKSMILLGLVVSGLTSTGMGLVNSLPMFYLLSVVAGFFADAAGPARQAMLADILPERKRADGFGIMRVVMNLAVAIGPAVGGMLAATSYLLLFVIDTITSLITALIVHRSVKETRPDSARQAAEKDGFGASFRGYGGVLKNAPFMFFLIFSLISALVYTQMYSTLSVYLRDFHLVPEQGFGLLMSLNAAMVVLLQFPITRFIKKFKPLLVMSAGTLLYAVGFGLYGVVGWYGFFLLAMVIITLGEMLVAPTGQALVARFSPEDMRGRYMAVMGFSWMIPSAFGPLGAGLIMDNGDPRWIWYISFGLGLAAAYGFFWLKNRTQQVGEKSESK